MLNMYEKSLEVLRAGGTIIYPTDTVFGLGCDATNPMAIKKIYNLKGRNFHKPLSILVADFAMLRKYTKINNLELQKLKKYLPGPFTFLVAKKNLPNVLTNSLPKVGVRMIKTEPILSILKKFKKPIVTTSANISGEKDVDKSAKLKIKADLIISGQTKLGQPSTVIDLATNKIIRPGVGKYHETHKNKIIILSAPSGTGKDTLAQMLLKKYPSKIAESVSVTDRLIRAGDIEGVSYFFVNPDKFNQMIVSDDLLEWEKYQGNRYGTSKKVFQKILKIKNVLLVIEVRGAKNIKKMFPAQVVSIFIAPPSLKVLGDRLKKRGNVSPKDIKERLRIAEKEIKQQKYYDKVVVNDDLKIAFAELVDFLKTEQVL